MRILNPRWNHQRGILFPLCSGVYYKRHTPRKSEASPSLDFIIMIYPALGISADRILHSARQRPQRWRWLKNNLVGTVYGRSKSEGISPAWLHSGGYHRTCRLLKRCAAYFAVQSVCTGLKAIVGFDDPYFWKVLYLLNFFDNFPCYIIFHILFLNFAVKN